MPSATMDSTEETAQQDFLANAGDDLQPSTEEMGGAPTQPGGAGFGLLNQAAANPFDMSAVRPRHITYATATVMGDGGQPQEQQNAATATITPPTVNNAGTATPTVARRHQVEGLNAAVTRLYSTVTQEVEHALLQWQGAGSSSTEAAEAFREELCRSTDLQLIVAAPAGSPVLTVIHSVACFFSREALVSDLRNAIVGFVGDRTEHSQPSPIKLDSDDFKWKACKVVVDPINQTVFGNDPANKGMLWKPPNRQGEQTQQLPRLLLIPPCLIKFLITAPRTAWELHEEVVRLLGLDNPPIDAHHAELIIDWSAAAAQVASQSQDKKSMLEVKISPIFNTVGIAFQKWAYNRIEGTLGQSQTVVSQPQGGQPGGTPVTADPSVTALQGMCTSLLHQMQQQNSGRQPGTPAPAMANTPTLTKKDMYNEWQVASIKGWSCVKEATRIQRLWATIQGVKQDEIVRTEVRRGMDDWATMKGEQIEAGVFLPKDIVECIRKVTPCPGEPIPTMANADKGIGPLACRPWRSEEIEAELERERAAAATSGTRTFNEEVQMAARPSKDPPSDYLQLRMLLGTYCALLWALFGENCALYTAVLDIYKQLQESYIAMQQHQFTPLRCREITWAVICDAKRYFYQRVHPSELVKAVPSYPVSHLGSVLLDIQNMVPVLRGSMPLAWRADSGMTPQMRAPVAPSPLTGMLPLPPAPMFGAGIPAPFAYQQPTNQHKFRPDPAPPSYTPATGATPGDPLGHIHPIIRECFREYHQRFGGRVMLTKIMQGANLKWENMPYLFHLWDGNKSYLCYSYVCGVCSVKKCPCHAKGGHVPGDKLHPDFCRELCRKLKPGIDYVLRTEPPAPKKAKTAGSGGK